MRITRAGLLLLFSIGILLLSPIPAAASLDGPCEATGTIEGTTHNAESLPDVVVVPRETVVQYDGRHTTATAGTERDYGGGGVFLAIPSALSFVSDGITLATWGPGTTDKVSKAGPHALDLPDFVPGGIRLPVFGSHADSAGGCSGSGVVMIEGEGSFDAPAKIVMWSLTGLTALGMLFAARPRPI
jgi:hypothetical protein